MFSGCKKNYLVKFQIQRKQKIRNKRVQLSLDRQTSSHATHCHRYALPSIRALSTHEALTSHEALTPRGACLDTRS